MSLSTEERKLLRRLADAYAFIGDLRETGLRIGNSLIIQRTEGIEKSVELMRSAYPRSFQRLYTSALRRAEKERREMNTPSKPPKKINTDGERKETPRRKTQSEKQKGVKKEAIPRKRVGRKSSGIKRLKPE